ncbi:hypothetical protein [uncultured Sulfitobacter sp.]|uniref:hypothetical protein n=1 Tax=uncultured Sulfitobacter sp. TaxID=191468 RepID=UPI002614877A|nr:hypothetical protein [uncultured Sulfitobacter sp.]
MTRFTDPADQFGYEADREDCWDCGGTGEIEECACLSVEDVCMCDEPEPRFCPTCGGQGHIG